ncbi:unnamed protein product [Soboliphyme baturini]|uniref:Alpha-1,3-mannosyl-glycoprotein 2-beta-N-acetylglucosaminyltransferase n=1 Tax=Soboliphyme baturini TaxID=241478 RepID=A0A183IDN1_9BILA|nr:unnamed protein product [Soboliphyme baturini]
MRIVLKFQTTLLLFRLRPSRHRFPIIVSLDCNHGETEKVVRSFGDAIKFIKQPNQTEPVLPRQQKKFAGYYKIARHYRWALSEVFYRFGYNATVITEDDLEVAKDFFSYFSTTYPLLKKDESLFCISAWNDNGKPGLIENDPTLLHRTDFFPGLGWMLTKDLWNELEPKWPQSFWDDWIRASEQRKNRACIRPEISRTAMALEGKIGVSKGQYYEKHLKHIKLNKDEDIVDFEKLDLSYLLKDTYDQHFVQTVYSSPELTLDEFAKLEREKVVSMSSIRFTYTNAKTFKRLATKFQLMDDFRVS